ncbi:MAG: hypothetical protein EA379_02165 [Phycisphaerales bacterium]|nr:MAG: hypothetical protein EA379_02165 [Phycisphaerales bacterium]
MRFQTASLAAALLIVANCCPALMRPASGQVTRADLAAAYLRVDHAYAEGHPGAVPAVEAHRTFDRISLSFFSGDFASAVRALDALYLALRPDLDSPAMRAALALRIEAEPPTITPGRGVAPTLQVSARYAPEGEEGAPRVWVRLRDPAGAVVFSALLPDIDPGARFVPLAVDAPRAGWSPGVYTIEIATAQRTLLDAGRLVVADSSLDTQREALLARLRGMRPANEAMERAAHACASRLGLLADRPSPMQSAQWLADQHALLAATTAEVDAIEAGSDPYIRRTGDAWMSIRAAGQDVPLRIYVPEELAHARVLAPIVVAIHGAGGDENMFMDAYGAGAVKRLADAHGLIVVAPLNTPIANPAAFDDMIDFIAERWPVDRSRIILVGHSMGAGVAAAIGRARPEGVRAVVCIAGPGMMGGAPGAAPTLVIGAGMDPIIPLARIEQGVERARGAGADIELRVKPDMGHTLVVTDTIDEALRWALAQEGRDRNQP